MIETRRYPLNPGTVPLASPPILPSVSRGLHPESHASPSSTSRAPPLRRPRASPSSSLFSRQTRLVFRHPARPRLTNTIPARCLAGLLPDTIRRNPPLQMDCTTNPQATSRASGRERTRQEPHPHTRPVPQGHPVWRLTRRLYSRHRNQTPPPCARTNQLVNTNPPTRSPNRPPRTLSEAFSRPNTNISPRIPPMSLQKRLQSSGAIYTPSLPPRNPTSVSLSPDPTQTRCFQAFRAPLRRSCPLELVGNFFLSAQCPIIYIMPTCAEGQLRRQQPLSGLLIPNVVSRYLS